MISIKPETWSQTWLLLLVGLMGVCLYALAWPVLHSRGIALGQTVTALVLLLAWFWQPTRGATAD
jgi:Flp pilus assembly protein TadB